MLAHEFPNGMSVTDFIWKYMPDEDREKRLAALIDDFGAIHESVRREIRMRPVSEAGEKTNLADELKAIAAGYENRSIRIEEWLQQLDRAIGSQPGKPSSKPTVSPEIVRFTVSRTSVASGGSVVVGWETRNTTSVVLEQTTQSGTQILCRVVGASGEWMAENIDQPCTFELKAIRLAVINTQRIAVDLVAPPAPKPSPPPPSPPRPAPQAQPPPPKPQEPRSVPRPDTAPPSSITAFGVTPRKVRRGGSVSVTWEIGGGSSAWLELKSAQSHSVAKFPVPLRGSHVFSKLERPATVELLVNDSAGHTLRRTIRIPIGSNFKARAAAAVLLAVIVFWAFARLIGRHPVPPPAPAPLIVSLETRPRVVRSRQRFTLRWTTRNVAGAFLNGRPVPATGSVTMRLDRSQSLTLWAKNNAGVSTQRTIWLELPDSRATQPPPNPGPEPGSEKEVAKAEPAPGEKPAFGQTERPPTPVPVIKEKDPDPVVATPPQATPSSQTTSQPQAAPVAGPVLAPRIDRFDVQPVRISSGSSVRVTWSAQGASASLNGASVPLSGSRYFPGLVRSTTMTLVVAGPDGRLTQASSQVVVETDDLPPGPPLTLHQVQILAEGGVDPSMLQRLIEKRGVGFEVTPVARQQLFMSGAAAAVVNAASSNRR